MAWWMGPEYGSSKLTDLGYKVADEIVAPTGPKS
jgi:hypothetical protein